MGIDPHFYAPFSRTNPMERWQISRIHATKTSFFGHGRKEASGKPKRQGKISNTF